MRITLRHNGKDITVPVPRRKTESVEGLDTSIITWWRYLRADQGHNRSNAMAFVAGLCAVSVST
jgi:hypothetical protein